MSPLRPSAQRGRALGAPGPRRGVGEGSTPSPTYFVLSSRAGGCWRLSRGPWALPAGLCSAPSRPSPPSLDPGSAGRARCCGVDTAAVSPEPPAPWPRVSQLTANFHP